MVKYFPVLAEAFGRLRTDLAGRPLAIIGHARPDGDCIGSQVALARVLMALGHDVICVNADCVPRRLEFLTQGLRFYRTDDLLALTAQRAAIYVDCADQARAGERLKAHFASPAASIDHHLSNLGFGAINLIDVGAAATCEILAGLFFDAGLPIDALTAQALYTGIVTTPANFDFRRPRSVVFYFRQDWSSGALHRPPWATNFTSVRRGVSCSSCSYFWPR